MKYIIKSEWNRYSTLVWALLVCHLALLWTANAQGYYKLWSGTFVIFLEMVAPAVAGFIFGAWQFKRHTNVASWTYLFHRPTAPDHVLFAILISGALILFIVLALPNLLVIGTLDLASDRVVDNRHYGFPLFLIGTAFVAYLMGAWTALYPNKLVVATLLLLPLAMHMSVQTTPVALILTQLALILLLVCLVRWSFKGDLATVWRSPGKVILAGIPLGYVFMQVAAVVTVPFYHVPLFMMGTHPDVKPIEGTYEHYLYALDEAEQIPYFLNRIENMDPEERASLRARALAGNAFSIRHFPFLGQQPLRHFNMHQDRHSILGGAYKRVFSHDAMLFRVERRYTKPGELNWIGRRGFLASPNDATDDDRFESTVSIFGPIKSNTAIYDINVSDQSVTELFKAQPDELLIGSMSQTEDYRIITSTKRTYFFSADDDFTQPLTPAMTIDHPRLDAPLNFIRAVRMGDDFMLTYVTDNYFKPNDIQTVATLVGKDGNIRELGRYNFTKTRHPLVTYFMPFVASPLLYELDRLHWTLLAPGQRKPNLTLPATQIPPALQFIALVLNGVGAMLCFAISRRRSYGGKEQTVFASFGLIMGIVAPLALLALGRIRLPRIRKKSSAHACHEATFEARKASY